MSLGPKALIPQSSERLQAVNDLIDEIEGAIPKLTSRRDLMPRHMAAMGLARCDRLLRGMVSLREANVWDASGVLFRPLWETWLISSYCLYLGESALEDLRAAAVEQVEKLPAEPFAEAKEILKGWKGKKKKLKVEQVANAVADYLRSKGKPDYHLVRNFYEVLYRGESTLNIHAGVHSIAGHLVAGPEYVGVNSVRYSPDEGVGSVLLAASFVGILAKDVFSEFGLGIASLDAIGDRITKDLGPDSLIIEPD